MIAAREKMLEDFRLRRFRPGEFTHACHVQVAYELLRTRPFLEAVTECAAGIDEIASNAGAPDKFNLTITVAFLSVIAERMRAGHHSGFAEFIADNADLLSKDVLMDRYSAARLMSAMARRSFLLPDKAA